MTGSVTINGVTYRVTIPDLTPADVLPVFRTDTSILKTDSILLHAAGAQQNSAKKVLLPHLVSMLSRSVAEDVVLTIEPYYDANGNYQGMYWHHNGQWLRRTDTGEMIRVDDTAAEIALAADQAISAAEQATTAAEGATRADNRATANEDARVQAEYERKNAETQRQQHEQTRQNQETAREQQAAADHTTAQDDHNTATQDHATAQTDHSKAAADHTTAESDHSTAQADHNTAQTDHSTAQADHANYTADRQTFANNEAQRQQTFETNEAQRQQDFEQAEEERMQTMTVTTALVDTTTMCLMFVQPSSDSSQYRVVNGCLNISTSYMTT